MSERRLQRIRISTNFLAMLMSSGIHVYRITKDPIPRDAKVVAVHYGESAWYLDLWVESESFAPITEGGVVPYIDPGFEAPDGMAGAIEWMNAAAKEPERSHRREFL